jgi:F-type H+-transporting ATPase subunit epsilon
MQCKIVSASEEIFSSTVKSVVATASGGDIGIYPGHTPLLSALQPAPVRIIDNNDKEHIVYVAGGFLEVQPKVVTILADSAIRSEDLDEKAITAAAEQVKQELKTTKDLAISSLLLRLAEFNAQLRTIRQSVKH